MARVSFAPWFRNTGVAVLWLALFAAVGIGVTISLSGLVPGIGGREWWLARNGLYELAGFAAATWVVGRLANRYSWDRMGWRPLRAWPVHFLRGLGIGAGMAAIAILLAVVGDGAELRLTGVTGLGRIVGPLAIGFCAAALSEELMWRGYPLRRLADALGPVGATAILAIGFGAAHLANPEAGPLAMINIVIAGLWLALAFFSNGGMVLAWGLHFGWNAALSLVFDAPVSGIRFDVPGFDYIPGAHAWIDGGHFGPEGGVIGTLVFCCGIALLLGRELKRPRSWQAQAAA